MARRDVKLSLLALLSVLNCVKAIPVRREIRTRIRHTHRASMVTEVRDRWRNEHI